MTRNICRTTRSDAPSCAPLTCAKRAMYTTVREVAPIPNSFFGVSGAEALDRARETKDLEVPEGPTRNPYFASTNRICGIWLGA